MPDNDGAHESAEIRPASLAEDLWQALLDLQLQRRSETVDAFGYDQKFAEWWQPRMEFFYRSYFRTTVTG